MKNMENKTKTSENKREENRKKGDISLPNWSGKERS